MADDPLDDLTTEEKQALVNLVKNDNGFDLSRRDVLALAGGASLGAVLGGTGYSAMGSAKADASTSDSDGNVGLPNDPVDAWIEGLAGPTGSPIDLGAGLVPDTDASYDLGSSSNQFNNAYMSNAEVESVKAGSEGPSRSLAGVGNGGTGGWGSGSGLKLTRYDVFRDTTRWTGRPDIRQRPSDGAWLLLYRDGDQHNVTDDSNLFLSMSDDEGETWTAANTDLEGNSITGFPFSLSGENINSGISVICENGDILALVGTKDVSTSELTGTTQLRSTDGGKSWTDEGNISHSGAPYPDDNIAAMQDVVVEPGTGDIYVSTFVDPSGDGSAPFEAGLVRSTDNGSSWEWVSKITDAGTDGNVNESGLEYLGNSNLVVIMRNQGANTTSLSRSSNMGDSWSDLIDIGPQVGGRISRPRLYKEGSLVDGMKYTDGLLFATGRFQGGGLNSIFISPDNGRSWSYAFGLTAFFANDWSDAGYSTMAIRDDGSIYHIGYGGGFSDADLVDGIWQRPSTARKTTYQLTNFENGGLGNWTGDTTEFTVDKTDPVMDGLYSLKTNQNSGVHRIISSGLTHTPQAGSQPFSALIRFPQITSGDSASFLFGVQDYDNLYGVQMHADNNELALFYYNAGSFNKLQTNSVQIDAGKTYEVIVSNWFDNDNTISAKLRHDNTTLEVATEEYTNERYSTGGIGFAYTSGADVAFDSVALTQY